MQKENSLAFIGLKCTTYHLDRASSFPTVSSSPLPTTITTRASLPPPCLLVSSHKISEKQSHMSRMQIQQTNSLTTIDLRKAAYYPDLQKES